MVTASMRTFPATIECVPGKKSATTPTACLRQRGFTLLELSVVMLLLAIAAAVAAPQFFPALRYASAEWEARQLAGFGTEAAAEAALSKDSVFVRIDLSQQEYFAVRLIYPEPDIQELAERYAPAAPSVPRAATSRLFGVESGMPSSASGAPQNALSEEEVSPEDADLLMRWKVDQFVRRNLESRARNVIHTEGLFEDTGPLFEKSFSFEEEEPEEEELGGLLDRRFLPEGIRISSVTVNGETFTRGLVEIEVMPTGFPGLVEIALRSDDGESFVVTWDPMLNRGVFQSVGGGAA